MVGKLATLQDPHIRNFWHFLKRRKPDFKALVISDTHIKHFGRAIKTKKNLKIVIPALLYGFKPLWFRKSEIFEVHIPLPNIHKKNNTFLTAMLPYCIIVVVAIFISHIFTLGVNKLWSGNVLHHNLSSTRKATLVEKSSTSSVGKVTLVEAATYRPYRLCHALFGCTALIPRCNCIDFKQVKFWETLLRTLNLNFLRS